MRRLVPIISKLLLVFVGYVVVLNIHTTIVTRDKSELNVNNQDPSNRFLRASDALDQESRESRRAADSLAYSDQKFHDHILKAPFGGADGADRAASDNAGAVPPGGKASTRRNTWSTRGGGKMVNDLFDVQGKFRLATYTDNVPIFYDEVQDKNDDRIWNQMRYIPASVVKNHSKTKRILLYNGLGSDRPGRSVFEKCPVKDCDLMSDRSQADKADLIVWQNVMGQMPFFKRPFGQIWAVFMLESPYHTSLPSISSMNYMINWTATYRHDSTIVTPYFKYTPYDFTQLTTKQTRNYAAGKTKKVAWFVSNCGARNRRLEYARQLSAHIKVDIYGHCGSSVCPRSNPHACFDMLKRDYKFYLAFENSNCRDYITEKYFLNALSNDILPIVMGAHPEDYRRASPPHSFIHVDEFSSPARLARYLHHLDQDDEAYNAYFAWKGMGLVDTNTFFWCRLCMMTHEATAENPLGGGRSVHRVAAWWNADVCSNKPWVKPERGFSLATDFDLDNKEDS